MNLFEMLTNLQLAFHFNCMICLTKPKRKHFKDNNNTMVETQPFNTKKTQF